MWFANYQTEFVMQNQGIPDGLQEEEHGCDDKKPTEGRRCEYRHERPDDENDNSKDERSDVVPGRLGLRSGTRASHRR